MKFILMVLLTIPVIPVLSQDIQFTVTANNKSITVSPDNEIEDKLLLIDQSKSGNDFLTIHVTNEETGKDWKRSFLIYDSADNVIKDIVSMKNGSYCIKLNELKILLHTQQDYFIYTTAIPKDPKKAMLVKVARIFVCRIRIL